LRYRTPGGGGFGPPAERDPDAVRTDLLDGYTSAAEAERAYGVILETEGVSG
jgi:N-methylhydantoinase B